MIHSMTKAEVEKAGALLIDTLKEGEVLYPSILLRGTKEKMKKFLLQVIEEQDCYADFYYPSLKKEEKEHFLSGLSAEENHMYSAWNVRRERYTIRWTMKFVPSCSILQRGSGCSPLFIL